MFTGFLSLTMKKGKFSQAERKKLIICRERVFDVRCRVQEVADAMASRGQTDRLSKYLPMLTELDKVLESVQDDN